MQMVEGELHVFCSKCKEVLNAKNRKKFNAGSKWQKPSMPKGCQQYGSHIYYKINYNIE